MKAWQIVMTCLSGQPCLNLDIVYYPTQEVCIMEAMRIAKTHPNTGLPSCMYLLKREQDYGK